MNFTQDTGSGKICILMIPCHSLRNLRSSGNLECDHFKTVLIKYVWFKYDLGQKYYAPQVRPDWGSNA